MIVLILEDHEGHQKQVAVPDQFPPPVWNVQVLSQIPSFSEEDLKIRTVTFYLHGWVTPGRYIYKLTPPPPD